MAYTPELSLKSPCTLRRIAWALGIPMTQAIERVTVATAITLTAETETAGPIGQTVTTATVPTIIVEPGTEATETAG